ncbi:MAG TPA: PEP-CTERM sorting domain-containing protein [Pirellulales bacterium]|nr:PEP-CTERM sorting domain-containing protein [Pirellulales bacterium]
MAKAVPLTINNPNYTADEAAVPLPDIKAGSDAHINANSVTLGTATYFQKSWDAWNGAQPANGKWTLADGGRLANLGLNVVTFKAYSQHNANATGGVEIQVNVTYAGADRGNLVWSQGLYDNYTLGPAGAEANPVTPFYEMDTASASGLTPGPSPGPDMPAIFADPVYPYQYNNQTNAAENQMFYDKPAAPYESAFFQADAFLSKVDYTNRKLTIYDGVEYGFQLFEIHNGVPEPATWVLMLTGLALVSMTAARKRWACSRSA